MRFSLFSVLALGLLAGCMATRPGGAPASPIVGPTWALVALGGNSVDLVSPSEAEITFGPDGRVSGSTGCNRFFGTYTLGANNAVTFSQVGSTRMACPGAGMAQEQRFLEALNTAARVDVRDNRLQIISGSDVLLTFEAPQNTATVTGTLTYRERIALPPNAVAEVRLLDVSRADAASETIARTQVATDGRQVPIPFSLGYDASRIEARNRYAVRGEIRDASGTLLWATDTVYPVITNGAATTGVTIQLVQASPSAGAVGATALVGPTWTLTEIQAASGVTLSLDANAPYSVTFGADGRYSGQADCNRIGGAFTADGGALTLSQGLSTLAACPDGSASGDFLSVFNTADRYNVVDDRLMLTGSGGTLAFVRG